MRTLIAMLYLMALGWAISHYELDKLWLEAAGKAFDGLVRRGAAVHLEVTRGYSQPPGEFGAFIETVIWAPAVMPGE